MLVCILLKTATRKRPTPRNKEFVRMSTDEKNFKTFHMPKCKCIACGYPLDAVTSVGRGRRPESGDVTICMKCGHIMGFRKNQTVRNLTSAEMIQVAGDKRILAIQKARTEALPADFILNWPPKPAQ